MHTFAVCSKVGCEYGQSSIFFSLRQIQDRNRDSQLSLFLPFKWGLNSSEASSVSDVRDASNASKVSVPIFVSDANEATLVRRPLGVMRRVDDP